MNTAVEVHPWSEESLFSKAVLYIERMEENSPDSWQYGFWSALSLEILTRAALAHVSPTLLANNKDWNNLVYAIRGETITKGHLPNSLTAREVRQRLKVLVPSFAGEVDDFCANHAQRRNLEVHSGQLAFMTVSTTQWLPKFYLACRVLLDSMDKELSDLFSKTATAQAQAQIDSLEDAARLTVNRDIENRKNAWLAKALESQKEASSQAKVWARRSSGHRVECPACGSNALIQGVATGAAISINLQEDNVIQRQSRLPSSFECIACGLRISGLSKLSACGLGDVFFATNTYTAAEYFGLYTEDDLSNLYTEDEMDEARAAAVEELFEPDYNE